MLSHEISSPISNLTPKYLFKEFSWKQLQSAILNFWEKKLRLESEQLSSLRYFKPNHLSLSTPHIIWLSAGPNPYKVEISVIQAGWLSGRYRCEKWRRHSTWNRKVYCELHPCYDQHIITSLEHVLIDYFGLSKTRYGVFHYGISIWLSILAYQ